jgi:hypothetical protein
MGEGLGVRPQGEVSNLNREIHEPHETEHKSSVSAFQLSAFQLFPFANSLPSAARLR